MRGEAGGVGGGLRAEREHLGQRGLELKLFGSRCSWGAVGVTLVLLRGFATTGARPLSEFPLFRANAAGSSCASLGLPRSRQWSCFAVTFGCILIFQTCFRRDSAV